MNSNTKLIDFSQGIKDNEINYNFDIVQEQINRERLAIGGCGISYGLDFNISDFDLEITPGAIIDEEGNEIYFDTNNIKLEKPILNNLSEDVVIDSDFSITLKYIPYSINRTCTSQYETDNNLKGIIITDKYNPLKKFYIKNIVNNKIYLDLYDSMYIKKRINVTYNYTMPRIDTIYINEKQQICISTGLSSFSPSVNLINETKFTLGAIYIDPYYKDKEKLDAKAYSIPYEKKLRKIYIDKNNTLLLCGKPFDNFPFIFTEKPNFPEENMFWYDTDSNLLKVYKTIDGKANWYVVNNQAHFVIDKKVWDIDDDPENYPEDMQTFLFKNNELNLRYVPNCNEISIIIDNYPLTKDQYDEVIDNNLNNQFENSGIGFKLKEKLDSPGTVEVTVIHSIAGQPPTRYQRNATIVENDNFVFNSLANTKIFETKATYLVDNNQLEIYKDGKKLIKNMDFKEGVDLSPVLTPQERIGKPSKKFALTCDVKDGEKIEYKITTNIISYSDIYAVIENLNEQLKNYNQLITNYSNMANDINKDLQSSKTKINNDIKNINSSLENCISKTDTIDTLNLSQEVRDSLISGLIELTFTKKGLINKINDNIINTDFITVFDLDSSPLKILKKNIDYIIENSNGEYYIHFLEPCTINDGHNIYIHGIKIGRR